MRPARCLLTAPSLLFLAAVSAGGFLIFFLFSFNDNGDPGAVAVMDRVHSITMRLGRGAAALTVLGAGVAFLSVIREEKKGCRRAQG